MKSRREFLKEAATGAVLLGSSAAAEKLAFAAPAGKSKVVIARDASLHGAGTQPDEQRVLDLLDKAMAAYTGRQKPVEAWKSIIPANILAGKTIGLKVNGLGGKGISTHAVVIQAICGVTTTLFNLSKASPGAVGSSANTSSPAPLN